MFNLQGFYYFAILEDLALRFIWALSFYLTEMKIVSGDIMTSITGILEVFRWVQRTEILISDFLY